jgi:endo-1,4-beta-mannosidase
VPAKCDAATIAIADPARQRPFLLGVNYWPRCKAMYCWSNFDADEVRREFHDIRTMGFGLVRIFLLWESFQPTATGVERQALADLAAVCDIAAESDLTLDVTFFTGHMSGPNWVPAWLLRSVEPRPTGVLEVVTQGCVVSSGYANPFTDALALKRAEDLLREVVREIGQHPAVAIWNLGNEPDLFGRPPDAKSGREWIRRMADVIRDLDPMHPVTCGLHVASLVEDNGFRVSDVFGELDMATMHAYPMYVDWASGPLDVEFVPFTCALTAALSGEPTLMEEFGGCTEDPDRLSNYWDWTAYGRPRRQFMASEEELAAYVEQVLCGLVNVGALGAVLWCYADYVPALWDRPPCDQSWHERRFGLVRPDGSWKPHAFAVQRFAASRPLIATPASHAVALDVTPEQYYRDPHAHARRLYKQFRST